MLRTGYAICFALCAAVWLNRDCFGADPLGTVERQFDFHANGLLADPYLPYVYATTDSGLEIIDTNSITVTNTIPLPSASYGMSLSPDGQYLYIAGGSTYVVDTQTQTLQNTLPGAGLSVAAGFENRLYVLTGTNIFQMDATTGASTGPDVPADSVNYGGLQISPDRKTLYYANFGISPGSITKIDVTTSTPNVLWTNNGTDFGENGEQLVLSHNGSKLAYVSGYGYLGYKIPAFDTDDMTVNKDFATGAYPNALAFSPGDKFAFALHSLYPTAVDVYDVATSEYLGQFSAADRGHDMVVDRTGATVFVSFDGIYYSNSNLIAYSTGEFVPEPSTMVLAALGICLVVAPGKALSKRRR